MKINLLFTPKTNVYIFCIIMIFLFEGEKMKKIQFDN